MPPVGVVKKPPKTSLPDENQSANLLPPDKRGVLPEGGQDILAPVNPKDMPDLTQPEQKPTVPFKSGDETFDIPENEVANFKQAFPDAIQLAEHPFGWRPPAQGDELMKAALNHPFNQMYEGMEQIRGTAMQGRDVLSGTGNLAQGLGAELFSPYTMAVEGWKQVPVIGPTVAKLITAVPEFADALAKTGFSLADALATMSGMPPEKRVDLVSKWLKITPEQAQRGLEIWGENAEQLGMLGLIKPVGTMVGKTLSTPVAAAQGAFNGAVRGGAETVGEGVTGRNLLETVKGAIQGGIGGAITDRYGDYPAHRLMASVLKDEIPSLAVKGGLESNVDELSRGGLSEITKQRQVLADMRNQLTSAAAQQGGTVDFNKLISMSVDELVKQTGTGQQNESRAAINEAARNTLTPIFQKYPDGRVPIDQADIELQTLWDKADKAFKEADKVDKGNTATTASLKGKLYQAYGGQILAGIIGHPESYPVSGIGEQQGMMKEFQAKFKKSVEKMEEADPRLGGWLSRIILHSAAPLGLGLGATAYTGNQAYWQAAAGISGLQAFAELWLKNPQNRYELARTINKYQKAGAPLLKGDMINPEAIARDIGDFYRRGNTPPQDEGGAQPTGMPVSPDRGPAGVLPPPGAGTVLPDATQTNILPEGQKALPEPSGKGQGIGASYHSPMNLDKLLRQGDVKGRNGEILGTEYRIDDPESPAYGANIFVRPGENLKVRLAQKEADFANAKKKVDSPVNANRARVVLTQDELQDPEVQKSIDEDESLTQAQKVLLKSSGMLGQKVTGQVLPYPEQTHYYRDFKVTPADRGRTDYEAYKGTGNFPEMIGTPAAKLYIDRGAEGKHRFGVTHEGIDNVIQFFKDKYPNLLSLVKRVGVYYDKEGSKGHYTPTANEIWINLAHAEDEPDIASTLAHELTHGIDANRNPIQAKLASNESIELAKRGHAYQNLPNEYRQYKVQEEAIKAYARSQVPEIFKYNSAWDKIDPEQSESANDYVSEIVRHPINGEVLEGFGSPNAEENGAYLIKQDNGKYVIILQNGGIVMNPEGKMEFPTPEEVKNQFDQFIEQYGGKRGRKP